MKKKLEGHVFFIDCDCNCRMKECTRDDNHLNIHFEADGYDYNVKLRKTKENKYSGGYEISGKKHNVSCELYSYENKLCMIGIWQEDDEQPSRWYATFDEERCKEQKLRKVGYIAKETRIKFKIDSDICDIDRDKRAFLYRRQKNKIWRGSSI